MSSSASPAPAAPPSPEGGPAFPPWVPLVAVAIGAAGLGFSLFMYAVPYRRAVRELKMVRGDLLQARADLGGRDREIAQLRSELAQAQHLAGDAVTHVRSETAVMRLRLQEQVASAPSGAIDVQVDGRGVTVEFSDGYLWRGGGVDLTPEGTATLRVLGRAIGKSASRILVTSPMGRYRVPAELAKSFSNREGVASERVKSVVQILAAAGVPSQTIWGVSTGGPEGDKEPVVRIEIAPGR